MIVLTGLIISHYQRSFEFRVVFHLNFQIICANATDWCFVIEMNDIKVLENNKLKTENETTTPAKADNDPKPETIAATTLSEKKFLCHVCSKSFLLKHHLLVHLKVHTNEKDFECEICDKKFRQRSHLYQHRKFHAGNKQFPCEYCHKSFMQRCDLKRHLKTHRSELPFHCSHCVSRFSDDIERQSHERSCPNRRFKCSICDFETTEINALHAHKRMHDDERRFKCDICQKAFRLKHHLAVHLKTHATEKERKHFPCHICEKKFSFKSNLGIHLKYHKGEKEFVCNLCSKSFVHRGDLNRHLKVHKKDAANTKTKTKAKTKAKTKINKKNAKTPIPTNFVEVIVKEEPSTKNPLQFNDSSNSDFQDVNDEDEMDRECSADRIYGDHERKIKTEIFEQNLDVDVLIVEPEKTKSIRNAEASVSMVEIEGNTDHLAEVKPPTTVNDNLLKPRKRKIEDNSVRKFVCDICSKRFRLKHHLLIHLNTHTEIKDFQCEICSKRFKQSSHLGLHQKTHTGEKPVPCPYCPKRFIHSGDLNRHLRCQTHREELPFFCESCCRRFPDQSSKELHTSTCTMHILECKMCDYKTSVNSRFKTHMKSHSVRQFQCEICAKKFIYKQNLDNHLKIHSDERSYQCECCARAFRLNAHLQRHLKKVHKK